MHSYVEQAFKPDFKPAGFTYSFTLPTAYSVGRYAYDKIIRCAPAHARGERRAQRAEEFSGHGKACGALHWGGTASPPTPTAAPTASVDPVGAPEEPRSRC